MSRLAGMFSHAICVHVVLGQVYHDVNIQQYIAHCNLILIVFHLVCNYSQRSSTGLTWWLSTEFSSSTQNLRVSEVICACTAAKCNAAI